MYPEEKDIKNHVGAISAWKQELSHETNMRSKYEQLKNAETQECPTCEQPIDMDFVMEHYNEHNERAEQCSKFVRQEQDKLEKLEDENKIYDTIVSHTFNPKKHSYIKSKSDNQNIFFDNVNQLVTIEKWSPNEIHFKTETSSEQFLIISEIFFPYGWELTNGSRNFEIYEVNNLVRGFFVPEGKNSFIMRFVPKDVIWGKRLSLFSLCIISLLIIIFYKKKINV